MSILGTAGYSLRRQISEAEKFKRAFFEGYFVTKLKNQNDYIS